MIVFAVLSEIFLKCIKKIMKTKLHVRLHVGKGIFSVFSSVQVKAKFWQKKYLKKFLFIKWRELKFVLVIFPDKLEPNQKLNFVMCAIDILMELLITDLWNHKKHLAALSRRSLKINLPLINEKALRQELKKCNFLMCVMRKLNQKSLEKCLKSVKHLYNSEQIGKIRRCNITLFSQIFEKHFQSDKHLVKTGQKIDAMEASQFEIETDNKCAKS